MSINIKINSRISGVSRNITIRINRLILNKHLIIRLQNKHTLNRPNKHTPNKHQKITLNKPNKHIRNKHPKTPIPNNKPTLNKPNIQPHKPNRTPT